MTTDEKGTAGLSPAPAKTLSTKLYQGEPMKQEVEPFHGALNPW